MKLWTERVQGRDGDGAWELTAGVKEHWTERHRMHIEDNS